jgi:hypothetical protein
MPARQSIAPNIGGHDFWQNGQSFLQLRNFSNLIFIGICHFLYYSITHKKSLNQNYKICHNCEANLRRKPSKGRMSREG